MLRAGADLHARIVDVDPAPWLPALRDTLRGMRCTGQVRWRTLDGIDVRADGTVAVRAFGMRQLPAQATFALRGEDGAIVLQHVQASLAGLSAAGSGRIACSPLAWLDDLAAIRAAAVAADLHVPPVLLEQLPISTVQELGFDEVRGAVSAQARLRGSLAAPESTAHLLLSGGRLRTRTGERIDDLGATVTLTKAAAHVMASATRGKGPLAATGTLTAATPLWEAGASARVALSLTGSNVLLHRGSGVRVRADVDLIARGPLDDIVLGGSVALRDSRIVTRVPLIDLRRTGGVATSTGVHVPGFALPAPLRARFDVDVSTKEPFVVKTNVLEGNLFAQLRLLGPTDEPRLQGTISGPDATVILPGMRMQASALLLQFTAENPTLPTLTLNARGRRHGHDVQVTARGRYDRPDVEFSSDPPLPPDELIVLVTTGARPSALRSTTGVGTVLGTYAAQEFADWVFGSESTEAKERFLDRFTVETGTEMSRGGNESIVVEFRLGEHLFLQGERDVYEDVNMGLVYRVRFK
jgi:autotransporter translocation and assembly factor TamB